MERRNDPGGRSAGTFSNPSAGASAGAADYIRRLLALLGDRDPFAVQESLVPSLREEVEGMSADELKRPGAPGKWSVLEVVRHLADTEIVYGYRMRLILAEDSPAIPGYDQDAWARNLRYRDADLESALRELEVLRAGDLALLRTLDEAAWERSGHHSERGEESVRQIFRLLAAHDLVHLRQIRRIKAAHGAG